jgi:hypothetical protein
MRRRFFIALAVFLVLLLALGGFTVRRTRRLVTRAPQPVSPVPAFAPRAAVA